MNQDLDMALAMRRKRGLDNHMQAFEGEPAQSPLSDDMAKQVGPDAGDSNTRMAAMIQSPDEVPMQDAMKQTGEGYLTEPTPQVGMADKMDKSEGEDMFAKHLGSDNGTGLRGRAMADYKMKGAKDSKDVVK